MNHADPQDIVYDLKQVGVTITTRLVRGADSTDSVEFVITAPIFKNSPFVHPTLYSVDYDRDRAYREVAFAWAARLGYGYKTVFGVL